VLERSIRLVACQATQMNKRKADTIKGATRERSLYRHLAQPSTLDGIRGGLTHANERAPVRGVRDRP